MANRKRDVGSEAKTAQGPSAGFTAKQGQYLAYLDLYRRLHRCSPSESEVAEYFRVSPPAAHQMIVTLEEKGLITREPGVSRSIRVAVPRSEIPMLDDDEKDGLVSAGHVCRDAAGPAQL